MTEGAYKAIKLGFWDLDKVEAEYVAGRIDVDDFEKMVQLILERGEKTPAPTRKPERQFNSLLRLFTFWLGLGTVIWGINFASALLICMGAFLLGLPAVLGTIDEAR